MNRKLTRVVLAALAMSSMLAGGAARASGTPNAKITGNITFECTITILFPQPKDSTGAQCDGTWAGWVIAAGDNNPGGHNGQVDHYIPDPAKVIPGPPPTGTLKVYNIQYGETCTAGEPLDGEANGHIALQAILDASSDTAKPLLTKHTIHAGFEYTRIGLTFRAVIGPNKKGAPQGHIHSTQIPLADKHIGKAGSKWINRPLGIPDGRDGTAAGVFVPLGAPGTCGSPTPLTLVISGTAVLV